MSARLLVREIMLSVIIMSGTASAAQVDQMKELARASDAIVVGRVTGVWWIFDDEKAKQFEAAEKPTRLPEGRYAVPARIWDSKIVIGIGYQVVPTEVIKGGKAIKTGQTITVFMTGYLNPGNQAVLVEKRRYVLLLHHVRPTKSLERARINSTTSRQGGRPIDFATLYAVTGDRQGAIEITGDAKKVIDQFKAKIRGYDGLKFVGELRFDGFIGPIDRRQGSPILHWGGKPMSALG